MTITEFKAKFRELLEDPWRDGMETWLECCHRLHARNAILPREWQFDPDDINAPVNWYWNDRFNECSTEELYAIGTLLFRYCLFMMRGIRIKDEKKLRPILGSSKPRIFIGSKGTIDSGLGGSFSIECFQIDCEGDTIVLSYWKVTTPGWTAHQPFILTPNQVQGRIRFS